MNIEDDDFPDPDYGVFGDNNPQPPRLISESELREIAYWRKKQEACEKTSREFNSYMIELYNESVRK